MCVCIALCTIVSTYDPSLKLEASPLIQLEGLGERCKFPQWGLGHSPGSFVITSDFHNNFYGLLLIDTQIWTSEK